jgi:hypothetical protein
MPEVRTGAALKVNMAHYEQLVVTNKAIWGKEEAKRAEEEAKQVKREEMEYLAATRLPPVLLSLQRTHQLFDHVLGLGTGSLPPSIVRTHIKPTSYGNDKPASTVTTPHTPNNPAANPHTHCCLQ